MTVFFVDDAHASVPLTTIMKGAGSGYVLMLVEDGSNENAKLMLDGKTVAKFSLGNQGYMVKALRPQRPRRSLRT
jgi:hypothetical protein